MQSIRRVTLVVLAATLLAGFALSSGPPTPDAAAGQAERELTEPAVIVDIQWDHTESLLMSYAVAHESNGDPKLNPAGGISASLSAGCKSDAIIHGPVEPLVLTSDPAAETGLGWHWYEPGTYSLVVYSGGWCSYYTTRDGIREADNDAFNALQAQLPVDTEVSVRAAVTFLNMPGLEPLTYEGSVPVSADTTDPERRRVIGTFTLPELDGAIDAPPEPADAGSEVLPAPESEAGDPRDGAGADVATGDEESAAPLVPVDDDGGGVIRWLVAGLILLAGLLGLGFLVRGQMLGGRYRIPGLTQERAGQLAGALALDEHFDRIASEQSAERGSTAEQPKVAMSKPATPTLEAGVEPELTAPPIVTPPTPTALSATPTPGSTTAPARPAPSAPASGTPPPKATPEQVSALRAFTFDSVPPCEGEPGGSWHRVESSGAIGVLDVNMSRTYTLNEGTWYQTVPIGEDGREFIIVYDDQGNALLKGTQVRGPFTPVEDPPPPAPAPSAAINPSWHPDPYREKRWRYHDGRQWTGHTAD